MEHGFISNSSFGNVLFGLLPSGSSYWLSRQLQICIRDCFVLIGIGGLFSIIDYC